MARLACLSALVFVALGAAATNPPVPIGSPTAAAFDRRADEAASLQRQLAHLPEEVRRSDEGSLVIQNANYRAVFSEHEGVRFTPRVEERYERQLSWQYRARSVHTETSQTPLDRVRPVVSQTGDHVVDFQRPGLIERYEGRRAGVEQIFVLTRRPDGSGDVRIRGEVTFAGERRRSGAALEFGTDGASLTYSAPIAYDAAHRPVPVRTDLDGDRLDLVLDGTALSGATFPVTIDPLFGATTTFANGDSNMLGHGVDVAYNWDRGEFLVVFDAMQPDRVIDRHIRAKRFTDNGDAVSSSYVIGDASVINLGARVAYDLHTNTYLVVWSTQGYLWARRLASDGAPLGEEFAIGPGRALAIAARNFHEHTASDTAFMVAWATDTAVRHARFNAAGQLLDTAQTNTTALASSPSVAVAYDPHQDRFLVAWQDGAIRARAIAPGGRDSPELVVSSGYPTTGNAARVSVAFDPSTKAYFLVAAAGGNYRGYFLSSEFTPAVTNALGEIAPLSTGSLDHVVTAWPGGFVLTHVKDDYTRISDIRLRGDGQVVATTFVDAGTSLYRVSAATAQNGNLFHAHRAWTGTEFVKRVANWSRWTARYVHGGSGDFDGDGRSDLFLFRNSNQFVVRTQGGSFSYTSGVPAGVPALLDWDGDGRADLATWRPQYGLWWIRISATGAIETVSLGRGGDVPVPGDYFGYGRDQVAVFRPSTGTWYIDNPRASAPIEVPFGQVGDMPVPADWNGDGDVDLGVWRPSTGLWYAAGVDGASIRMLPGAYGQAGDLPFAGNFVGDGTTDQVIYRRSNGRFYLRDGATGDTSSVEHAYGLPVPLDWDGDGRLDLVVADPDAGTWYIFSPSGNTVVTGFGWSGDIPAGGP
jgi:hypothetical protein